MRERERERDRRNLNPSKEAKAAMWLWGAEYAAQRGGSMDFWDKLDASRKRLCRDLVDDIERATWRSKR
jgi:hypothetical protein